MTTNVRHDTAPAALGCRWCGVEQRDHVQRYVPSKKWHGWEQPTRAQITARMWAHRASMAARLRGRREEQR